MSEQEKPEVCVKTLEIEIIGDSPLICDNGKYEGSLMYCQSRRVVPDAASSKRRASKRRES